MPNLFPPFKVPSLARRFWPGYIWKLHSSEKVVYLTFDDGPIPGITEWVLKELEKYNYKATFFMVGENAEKNPALVNQIREQGHVAGNHTYNHLNGWKTPMDEYAGNCFKCAEIIPGNLFRPPYGRIRKKQAQILKARGYRIIMWSLLTNDYYHGLNTSNALKAITDKTQPGEIVVFHDSIKAEKNLKILLPAYLKWLDENGYQSKALIF